MDNSLFATIILGGLGIFLTAYYSWHTKKIANEQMQKQLFTEFNSRYEMLNQHLVYIERYCSTIEELNMNDNTDDLKSKVIDYFSLCAEEFYWYYHKKRIEPLIFNSWQSGMNYWYNNVPAIKSLWEYEVEMNGKLSYYITDRIEFFIENEADL